MLLWVGAEVAWMVVVASVLVEASAAVAFAEAIAAGTEGRRGLGTLDSLEIVLAAAVSGTEDQMSHIGSEGVVMGQLNSVTGLMASNKVVVG